MGKKIGGGILLVWGLLIGINWLAKGMPMPGEGAYQGGMFGALIVGCIFLLAGFKLLFDRD